MILMCVRACVCVQESVFEYLYTAQLGTVVFRTLMKRDEDRTCLFSRHCLCHRVFKTIYQRGTKWLSEIRGAGFRELAEVYSSHDVWLRGVEFPPFVLFTPWS